MTVVTPPDTDRTAVDRLAAALARAGLADRTTLDRPLGPLTTYRVGGPAALAVEARTVDDVRAVAGATAGTDLPLLVVGRGSNMLVADEGFPGLAVQLTGDLESVAIEGTRVVAGGAAFMPVVARRTVAAGLTGFEWAVGVPGSIGGGVRMNAGGHGSDVAASITRAEVVDLVDGSHRWWSVDDLGFGFRHSALGRGAVVVTVELDLEVDRSGRGEAELSEIVRWRRENQPGGHNAGSVFVNPPGDSAGRLVDEAGCRGLRLGTAVVSPKHANFIVADEGGRAADVHALMGEVRRRVHDHHGLLLRSETVLVGFDDVMHASYEGEEHR